MRKFILALFVLALFVSFPLLGQTREGSQLVDAQLIVGTEKSDAAFTVGIRFSIQPEWYLYWKNPGDAGLPIEVRWSLPEGWKAGPLQFPVPEKFVHDDIIAYGYKDEVIVLATITPSGQQGTIEAKLDWLVCRESCLRGGTSVQLDLRSQNPQTREKSRTLIEKAHERLPGTQQESGVLFGKAVISKKDGEWMMTIPFRSSSNIRITDFYPESAKGLLPTFRGIVVRNDEILLPFTRQEEGAFETTLRGLLITPDTGFDCSIPLQFSSQ